MFTSSDWLSPGVNIRFDCIRAACREKIWLTWKPGCSVSNLLSAIDSFYKPHDEGSRKTELHTGQETRACGTGANAQRNGSSHDLAVASKVWRWLAARSDVSIGDSRQYNHMSLEDVLAFPEEPDFASTGAADEPSGKPTSKDTKNYSKSKTGCHVSKEVAAPTVRPRLHVSEERQWRTITGHGPDFKRVPLFEWRALVDIGSVKGQGILQGDLVRLTGQDKRSLPTRTDALARKGYVIKQPVVLRGGKSSKLWLTQFMEYAKEDQKSEGLDYETVDLSKAALTSDLQPVPFCDKWNRDHIDYLALAQAFVAIVKAWELIRYCDARSKLGVEERVRQMRALAKTCRWLTNIGALSFVGAKFAGSNRLFKDCVKYIRDPAPAEWAHFRATPKTRMAIPSGRIGKRGEASRAVHASQLSGPRVKPTGKKAKPRECTTPYTNIIPPPWKPQKPVPNTAFEIIKRAGPKGTSNAAVCRQTLGHNFRRLAAAMTGSISMPTNSQPTHLKHLSSLSQLSRIGKTMTYTFYAASERLEGSGQVQQSSAIVKMDGAINLTNAENSMSRDRQEFMFSQPVQTQFSDNPFASLAEITRIHQPRRGYTKKMKEKRPLSQELEEEAETRTPKRHERQPAQKIIEEQASEPEDTHSRLDLQETSFKHKTLTPTDDEATQPETLSEPARPPGVYRGLSNSIKTAVKRKGRKPKSLVLIFRSDKLKSLSSLGIPPAAVGPHSVVSSNGEVGREASTDKPSASTQETDAVDISRPDVESSKTEPDNLGAPSKAPHAKKNGWFSCDKCGNSWKNSNGLDYHLTKSRSTCNPDFVPPPIELTVQRKRKSTQPQVLERLPLSSEERAHPRATLTPREQMESRFDTKKRPQKRSQKPAQSADAGSDLVAVHTPQTSHISHPGTARGSIILKDLEVYDVAEHQRLMDQRLSYASGSISTSKRRRSAYDVDPYDHSTLSTPLSLNRHSSSRLAIDEGQTKPENPDMSSSNSPSKQVSSSRKPLPNIPVKRVRGSETRGSESSSIDSMAQGSMHKSLVSFARPTRANATFGARRRDRIMQIVDYLLYRNEGVFPGLRSLFMAVVSVWAKEFADLAPPDRRICQNTINQMERDGLIKQMHFFFFDDQAKMQECVVIAKADTRNGIGIKSSDDPRVIAVKEKMREMFPEAYVPGAFSLSPDEAKLFDELASQGREYNQTRSLRAPRDLKTVQDIETLRYKNSVMGDIFINRHNAKRPADEMLMEAQSPLKKTRVDLEPSDMIEKTRKHRRRPEKHEMWDSGKLAVYIWSQRQKASAMWEQHRCCLQDFNTGAWSWSPDIDNPQTESIANILSSVKSARHFDASLKRKGHKGVETFDPGAGDNLEGDNDEQNGDYISTTGRRALITYGDDLSSSDEDVLMTDEDESAKESEHGLQRSIPRAIFIASSPASFETSATVSDEEVEQEGEVESLAGVSDEIFNTPDASHGHFAPAEVLKSKADDIWPKLSVSFFESHQAKSFALVGPMPSAVWFLKENLPREAQDILKTVRGISSSAGWADPQYGEFLRKLKTIKRWERSVDGTQILAQGTIAPDYVFISLTPEESRANMKPLNLEWLAANQHTAANLPDEVKNASAEDETFGLSYVIGKGKRRGGKQRVQKRPRHKRPRTDSGYPDTFRFSESFPHQPESVIPEGFIEYKTRDLTVIPRQPRGRFNKPAAHDDKLGSKREDELVAACVVFRTLLGGLDRNLDIGLLLKHFPGMSLSALKKFWPRISRERKSYVQALTAKFQSEFLVAYGNGELPPLNYDDIENYDWPKVILWATKLETHEDVDLPESQAALHQKYLVEDMANEATDWRETWFATTSTYNRIEAIASETMSIPLPPKGRKDRMMHERARTWVRSICCTPLRGVNVKEKLVPKLLELGGGDTAETNRILEKVVAELNREKVITRTKGKDLGGNFRIHGMFSKQLEKMASTPKFRQAVTFKAQIDDIFRQSQEHIMPYAADDGAIMAVLNLQAHGRIRMETVDMPNIPFGFEPGNYEGRTFPKSYYHFKVRLTPTSTYLYNDDMALLKQAEALEPPNEGPRGKIPIWVDFFGKVNAARWADYVSMVVFTLAIKGPTVPKMCVTLLKPMIDEFEVQLIMDWLDQLGLLQRAVDGCGVTMAEWWWLVVGHIVQLNDKSAGRNKAVRLDA